MEKEKDESKVTITLDKRVAAVFGSLVILVAVFYGGVLHGGGGNNTAPAPTPDTGGQYQEPAPTGNIKDEKRYRDALEAKRDDAKRGSGEILLIEYSDYECPFCQRFHSTAQSLVDSGSVTWIYRHLPLTSLHPNAEMGARIGECVRDKRGQEAFWTYTDAVFASSSITTDTYRSLGRDAGLSDADIDGCVAEGSGAAKSVTTHINEANGLEIFGTPGSFLVNPKNGKFARVPGAVPLGDLQTMLQSIQ